ncbi:E3 ubiquitin-protein ligase TRIM35-like [Coregonus clupeaformis]|uniref:E3 ubiquitin-protein ligase TRIM35-like n=1 Tax=Coregonus clupeaformis TaxID=59861 RepID=UPI001BE089D5|nr:E3 ubiquitin-protein ligase TRIM35-like [Coregonus clupeaformis]XP_041691967.1 E3 ubiquitin-protein ligase TRIM35-like [Coregonus clupeaformis]XP_041691968.1 E3 ubiquitin-protein ligase TRIM35-like [Coregonus clupeaformis]
MADSYLDSYLCCHICSETFREPVSLGCHHSFCSSCLDKFWVETKNKNCPVCKRKSSKDNPKVNFQLKELSDKYAGREKAGDKECIPDEDREVVCTKHTDEPKWFCEVEQRAVCHVCEFPAHHGHTVIPLKQAVKDLKEKLTSDLDSLQSKQVKCKDIEKKYSKVVQYSKKQLVSTERQIRGEFEKLHQFLKKEEEARLAALREEEEEKGKMIAREIKNIQDQISSLTESITALKQELQKREVPFLKSYKHIQRSSRAQYTLLDPQLVSGALIDVAKHLGNLQFRVWEKIQGIVKYTPVILDPNTAARWLSLSDDLTSVSQTGPIQQLPDNPERSTKYATVLGSEGFSSGKHSWEVEVGDHPYWYIGASTSNPDNASFNIHLVNGKYRVGGGTITLKGRPQKIRVQLDYDRGEVSFYDTKDMTHIYTLKETFTERMYPRFSIGQAGDANHPNIQICQSEVSLTVMSSQ